MKFKGILTLCLAGFAASAFAQTHVEGAEYYKADQIENARELLTRSLGNAGTDKSVSNYYLGLIALRDGKKDEAQKYFEAGIAANPQYGYNYVGNGTILLLAGNEKEAVKAFKEAEKYAKKDPSLQIEIARAYDMADPVKFEKQIAERVKKARKWNMENPDIYIFEGDVLARQKAWGDAGAKYEMAANYNHNATDAYVKYANLFTMVNPQYAIDMLGKLLAENPSSALGQRELANAYYNGKDYTNAAAEYGKYVQNPAHFKQDENRYAFLLFYGGKYKDGYEFASKLLQQDPSNFTAQRYQFMNAAQLKEMNDKLLPLAEALYKAHKADPAKNKFAPIDFTLIADEFARAKRGEEAVNVLKEGIAEIPDNSAFYKDLAMKYVDINNITQAAEAWKQYISHAEEPSYNEFVQQATFSFYAGVENKENPEVAKKYFDETALYANKASEILPDNYRPKKFLGDIAKQTAPDKEAAEVAAADDYTKAIELLEASKDPSRYKRDAMEMYNYMGNYYLVKKDVAKAKEYFNKYLQLDPNNEPYRKFVEGLK